MTDSPIATKCCVVVGGPAGMMLGFLLARAGVDVVVLENRADFFRDFRGDTVHPSTLELMYELGLLDKFLALPHSKADHLTMQIGDQLLIACLARKTAAPCS
jgi:2-polyprenyl-6-methoxyphenol hydroxylase-like FAD-dependent oxidoreductase